MSITESFPFHRSLFRKKTFPKQTQCTNQRTNQYHIFCHFVLGEISLCEAIHSKSLQREDHFLARKKTKNDLDIRMGQRTSYSYSKFFINFQKRVYKQDWGENRFF